MRFLPALATAALMALSALPGTAATTTYAVTVTITTVQLECFFGPGGCGAAPEATFFGLGLGDSATGTMIITDARDSGSPASGTAALTVAGNAWFSGLTLGLPTGRLYGYQEFEADPWSEVRTFTLDGLLGEYYFIDFGSPYFLRATASLALAPLESPASVPLPAGLVLLPGAFGALLVLRRGSRRARTTVPFA